MKGIIASPQPALHSLTYYAIIKIARSWDHPTVHCVIFRFVFILTANAKINQVILRSKFLKSKMHAAIMYKIKNQRR